MQVNYQNSAVSLYSATGQRKYLNGPERVRFIAAAMACPRPELRTLCLVLAFTGCRVSEALNVVLAGIEIGEALIAFRSLKKRRKEHVIRQVPVPDDLIALLMEVHGNSKPDERLWPWCRSRAWQLVKSVMAAAGVAPGPHATPKGLRHGFGVHAIRTSVPLHLIQRWMGHASMTTTALYLEVIGPDERDIARRMWH